MLDFHLPVQQNTHSGHEIKQVRSSTYHFFNKLISSWNLQGRIKSYFLLHEKHKNQQFQFSVQIGFCTVHQSCLEIDIWHMLWQYLHDLSTKYKQNSPYFDKYFHFVWIKLCWMFLIIVNCIKIYWHGIFNDKHVYCNWEKKNAYQNANQL